MSEDKKISEKKKYYPPFDTISPAPYSHPRLSLPLLDKGIAKYVEILATAGIETYESCEGGKGHSFPEPTIRFHGDHSEGFKALAVVLQHALPVSELRRVWSIEDLQPVGPGWELVFFKKCTTSK